MPVSRRSRTLAAAPEQVWAVVRDPYHLPRWWPRVSRVEGVDDDRWTAVLLSKRGVGVRADYTLEDSVENERRAWILDVDGTAFERVFALQRTSVALEPHGSGTKVTLELDQRLHGSARLGGLLVRRAGRRQLDEALDGLERVS